jgi:hypothetical protein
MDLIDGPGQVQWGAGEAVKVWRPSKNSKESPVRQTRTVTKI